MPAAYAISVAADLVGMGVQNLRLYEARGLLEPGRTTGGTRRYSANDLDRLRRIGDLLEDGLNLAGIGMVLDLEAENAPAARGAGGPRRMTPGSPSRPETSSSVVSGCRGGAGRRGALIDVGGAAVGVAFLLELAAVGRCGCGRAGWWRPGGREHRAGQHADLDVVVAGAAGPVGEPRR